MKRILSYDLRRKIVRDHQAGKTLKELAEELAFSYSAVCKIWRLFKKKGESAFIPAFSNCGRRSPYDASISDLISAEKTGEQGASYIRSVLLEKYPDRSIPHERSIQRWWRKEGVTRPKGRKPKQNHDWTDIPHDTWQIDGKELVSLSTGEKICWVNIADEATSSLLQSSIFPLSSFVQDRHCRSQGHHGTSLPALGDASADQD